MCVPAEVRRTLQEARMAGVHFAEALSAVADRQWREALARTAGAWHAAYVGADACPRWVATLEDAANELLAA